MYVYMCVCAHTHTHTYISPNFNRNRNRSRNCKLSGLRRPSEENVAGKFPLPENGFAIMKGNEVIACTSLT
jgi:hypothetical protein